MAKLINSKNLSWLKHLPKLRESLVLRMNSSSNDLVETSKIDKTFLIGINRPEHRNAVNPETAHQLFKAFQQFEADDDCYVAVLHGKGGNFCAGFDLKALSQFEENLQFPGFEDSKEGPMGPSRMMLSKPVIGAISGYAVAGGLELALLCDLRVVEETTIMGVFCRRFGVPLIDGGTVRLPQLIGLSRALDLILTGRPIGGKEALSFGLANDCVSTGTALGVACLMAKRISDFPQTCLCTDRKSAYYSTFDSKSLDDALNYEYSNGIKVVNQESIKGAVEFTDGKGRHGQFKTSKL
ncbi:hypothetical protein LOTGIDRAFT_204583 [Lottia gigantea]|uniref:Enoyl-CoA hydratase n=1 Tax=Lottia gigantea TaxID=225164 RepID=V3Z5P9_LOTGI|nr:hypothetical protein LOTGIDRAFT_204583 [Lottia gigantea]ESO86098.1 hypothetical protein LOTGIDRAFT_204583 [Lottia gigantea]